MNNTDRTVILAQKPSNKDRECESPTQGRKRTPLATKNTNPIPLRQIMRKGKATPPAVYRHRGKANLSMFLLMTYLVWYIS